jgi:hypothetical protein
MAEMRSVLSLSSSSRFLGRVFTRRDALRLAQFSWVSSVAGFLLLVVPLFAYENGTDRANEAKDAGKLHDFKIAKPDFLVDGANLSKVEVWFWPTGTGITKPALVGTANRATGPGEHEKWVLRIPADLLAVEIFATAFDKTGNVIGKKSLPYKGASALYDALYGKK